VAAIERYDRRSWLHRPVIEALETSLTAFVVSSGRFCVSRLRGASTVWPKECGWLAREARGTSSGAHQSRIADCFRFASLSPRAG